MKFSCFHPTTTPIQVDFVKSLLSEMRHHQHGAVDAYLKPMLQRDFISLLPGAGLDHLAEDILGRLDAESLRLVFHLKKKK